MQPCWLRALTQSPDGYLWNVTLNLGAGGATCGTDTIGGVDYQIVKPGFGAAGAITLASPANPLPVRSNMGTTSTVTAVVANAASVTLLASAATRLRAHIYNDSDKKLFVKYGVTASAASYTDKLLPQQKMTIEDYTGRIDGIWEAAPTGNAVITEVTP